MVDLPTFYRMLRHVPEAPGCCSSAIPANCRRSASASSCTRSPKTARVPKVELRASIGRPKAPAFPPSRDQSAQAFFPSCPMFPTQTQSGVVMICKENPLQTDDVVDLVADLGGFATICAFSPPPRPARPASRRSNARFHAIMAAGRPALRGFSEGEPLIFLKNDYRRDLRNGSLGVVTEIARASLPPSSTASSTNSPARRSTTWRSPTPSPSTRRRAASSSVSLSLSCRRACSTARWSTRRSPERSRPPS